MTNVVVRMQPTQTPTQTLLYAIAYTLQRICVTTYTLWRIRYNVYALAHTWQTFCGFVDIRDPVVEGCRVGFAFPSFIIGRIIGRLHTNAHSFPLIFRKYNFTWHFVRFKIRGSSWKPSHRIKLCAILNCYFPTLNCADRPLFYIRTSIDRMRHTYPVGYQFQR